LGQLYANQVKSESGDYKVVSLLIIVIAVVWLIVNQAPIMYFVIEAAKGKSPTLAGCYRFGLRFFWQYLVLALGFILIVGVGLALYVVPGLIAAYFILRSYYLTPYYLIDQNLTIKQALAKCNDETKPYFYNILSVVVLQIILILGATLVGISSIVIGIGLSSMVACVSVFFVALRYQEITSKLPASVQAK
jgi:hypothetical protein